MTEPPRMRAGNSDRQAAVDRLGTHFADGRLDADEFDQRVAAAYRSTYLDELQPLFADLPEGRPERPAWDRGPSWDRGPRPLPGPGGRSGGRPGGPPPPIRIALFALFVMVMIWSVAVVGHGFFPFPLIWLFIAMMLMGRMRHRRHHYHGPR